MKKILKTEFRYWITMCWLALFTSCDSPKNDPKLATQNASASSENPLTEEFKAYWYSGEAEITSYKLQQARYGEMREGTAILIFVTEDFHSEKQVKADQQNINNISVLKLNATKEFNTGIYPYSIMQSTFYPLSNDQHALKVSSSIQEWCGHVYAQINNKSDFEVSSYSYFESEADQNFHLEKAILENEIWTQLRIDPSRLPQGDLKIIPSLEYTRLKHIPIKAYEATAVLEGDTYTISYPELDRTLTIAFNYKFPYEIYAWEETFKSGFGENAKILTTKATKLSSIKSKYWSKNSKVDDSLRKTLKLE